MNYFERTIAFLFPEWASKRAHARYITQAYDAARKSSLDDWTSASNAGPNNEVDPAKVTLTKRSRDLVRNNPYANKALNVICSNTIGYGIVPSIVGRNDTTSRKLKDFWEQQINTTKFDFYGKFDFYTLQQQAMRAMVEGGECFIVRRFSKDRMHIQLLESEFLNTTQDDNNLIRKGIKYDKEGRPVSYFLFNKHPDEYTEQSFVEVPADNVIHLYRPDRLGQSRGVPWSHPVIETLKDLGDFQYSTLVKQKVSACLVGVMTTIGESNLPAEILKERRKQDLKMIPGQIMRANPGEDIKFSNPPSSTDYAPYVNQMLRAAAAGYGISYEALSGDYSQTNFSSGRMGHHEFRRNIQSWQWNLFIPIFCDRIFVWFVDYAKLRGLDVEGAKAEWVPPAFVMIDPSKEIAADKEAVKAGFKSKAMVIREAGLNPDQLREEIYKEKQEDDKLGLKFDIYNETPLDKGGIISEVDEETKSTPAEKKKSKKKAE